MCTKTNTEKQVSKTIKGCLCTLAWSWREVVAAAAAAGGEETVTDGRTWQCGIHPARYSARPASGGRQGNKSWALHPVSTAYYIHHDK